MMKSKIFHPESTSGSRSTPPRAWWNRRPRRRCRSSTATERCRSPPSPAGTEGWEGGGLGEVGGPTFSLVSYGWKMGKNGDYVGFMWDLMED